MELGELVAGRFLVEESIGRGGMGVVFRAKDTQTGEPVALKALLHADVDAERFLREGRLLAELRHPGIVAYVAHGISERSEPYLAMRWLEGEDLSARIAREGLTLAESVAVTSRAAEALGFAHGKGIVHRDVKPSNLFLEGGDPERVVLLDFGIARDTGATQRTASGVLLGTPGYVAPEQARGEADVGPAADIFSLGCVAFECVTGERPFVADHALGVLLRILFEEPPRAKAIRSDVPDDLDNLLDDMLAKSPSARPRSGSELARRLDLLGRMPASVRANILPSPPALTEGEERIVSIVACVTGSGRLALDATVAEAGGTELLETELAATLSQPDALPSAATLASCHAIAKAHRAQLEVLSDGLLVALLSGAESAIDQAVRAARCALALRSVLSTAPMVLASGRRDTRARALVGDAIDRALRILDLGEPAPGRTSRASAGILVDDVSAALLDARFDVGGAPLELRGERDRFAEGRLLFGHKTPCIGRDRELAQLEGLFDECVSERLATAVLVTASPGVGKSRLRAELLARIGGRANTVWLGTGDVLRSGAPFGVLAPALRRAIGVAPGSDGEATGALLRWVSARIPGERGERVAQFLGEIAGVPFPDDESHELRAARRDPLVMGDQTRRAWLELCEAESRIGPLVVVLEDLHWGDLPSVKFCDALLRDLADRPIYVLAFARPEVDELFPQLFAKRNLQRLTLGPLTRSGSERFVRHALGAAASNELVHAVVARAGGNAFYLEELVRAVGPTGHRMPPGELPETILAMVEAHLDRLRPEARRVLRGASVFGQTFWRSGVDVLLGGEARRSQVGDRIGELVDEEVIRWRPSDRFPAEEEYAFQHALVRDAAYGTLTDEDRRLGHRLAASWLEAAGETDALLLAEHLVRGGEPARAAGWLVRAAEQAFDANDFDAAVERADRAITSGAALEVRGRLRVLQAEAHIWRSDHVRAGECLTEAIALLPRGGIDWCKAVAGLLAVHAHDANIGELSRMVEELRITDPTPAARGAYAMPASFVVSYGCALGIYPLAKTFLDRLVTLCEPDLDDPIALGWIALAKRQCARFVFGDPGSYVALGQAAVAQFTRGGDARNAFLARAWSAHAILKAGAPEVAEAAMRGLLRETSGFDLHYVDATAEVVLAFAVAAQRSTSAEMLAEARAAAERATERFGRSNRVLAGFARTALATVLLREGDFAGAEREAAVAAEGLFAAPPYRAHALSVISEASLALGRPTDALAAATDARAIVESLGAFEDAEARVRLVEVEARIAVGDVAGARLLLDVASERLDRRAATLPEVDRGRFLDVPENARIRALHTSL